MYGCGMKKRLSKTDWLDHGLKVLAKSGAVAMKAEPLAQSLKVSRGSFYWHFRDTGQFHADLLARWRQLTTDDIITKVDRKGGRKGGHGERLRLLMSAAMVEDDPLERAIRAWSTENEAVAKAVRLVDGVRLGYLNDILAAAGIPKEQVRARALFIYWARLGGIMMGANTETLQAHELDAIAALLQS